MDLEMELNPNKIGKNCVMDENALSLGKLMECNGLDWAINYVNGFCYGVGEKG